jgi:uncharacterized protein YfaQ (DUF2300 family)
MQCNVRTNTKFRTIKAQPTSPAVIQPLGSTLPLTLPVPAAVERYLAPLYLSWTAEAAAARASNELKMARSVAVAALALALLACALPAAHCITRTVVEVQTSLRAPVSS